MAVGTVDNSEKLKNVGIKQAPNLRTVDITTGTAGEAGQVTITANEINLTNIKGWAAGPWGATTGEGFVVSSTTAFVATGVTSIALEVVTDASVLTASINVTLLIWGD